MSRAVVILSIFTFYCVIFSLFGMVGYNDVKLKMCDAQDTQTPRACMDKLNNEMSGWSAVTVFISGIFVTIISLPWWANMIIFTPLTITLVWMCLEVLAVAVP